LAIARYKALSAIRRRSDEHLDDDVLAMIEDPADNPETLVEKEDRRAIVQNCLPQLSPTHREVGLEDKFRHVRMADREAFRQCLCQSFDRIFARQRSEGRHSLV
jgi:DNA-directed RNA polymerase specialized sigma24 family protein